MDLPIPSFIDERSLNLQHSAYSAAAAGKYWVMQPVTPTQLHRNNHSVQGLCRMISSCFNFTNLQEVLLTTFSVSQKSHLEPTCRKPL
jgi:hypothetical protein